MVHANACLTPKGRLRLASAIVEDGWTMRGRLSGSKLLSHCQEVADRYRDGGQAAMADRSVARTAAAATGRRRERRMIKGGSFIVGGRTASPHIGPASLHGGGGAAPLPDAVLRHLDQASGLPVRRPKPRRYEHPAPGDLVHVDIKKLGRVPTAAAIANWGGKSAGAAEHAYEPSNRRTPTRSWDFASSGPPDRETSCLQLPASVVNVSGTDISAARVVVGAMAVDSVSTTPCAPLMPYLVAG